MKLQTKLVLFLSAFLILFIVFASGTFYIFEQLGENVNNLRVVSEENRLYNELENDVGRLFSAVISWAYTGDSRFRRDYRLALPNVLKSFGSVSSLEGDHPDIAEAGKMFEEALEHCRAIISVNNPVGNPSVELHLVAIDKLGSGIELKIDDFQRQSVETVLAVASQGTDVRNRMIYYHLSLVFITTLITAFLIFRIRTFITKPFQDFLYATEQVSKGNLSHRLAMTRVDEFGLISRRFDDMVSDLEASQKKLRGKLGETELILEITRRGSETLNLSDGLLFVAHTLTEKLRYNASAIYIDSPEKKRFLLIAADGNTENAVPSLDSASVFIRRTASSSHPVVFLKDRVPEGEFPFSSEYAVAISAPIIRGGICFGVLAVCKNDQLVTEDELNILTIVSNTLASIVRNAELYGSTRRQLEKISLMFELSRAVASATNMEELLSRIAGDIARLLSAQGCIIRLLEEGRLRIKSSFGLPPGIERDMEVGIGESIAGKVAEQGVPLLIADVKNMPAGMQVPVIDASTALCVPMKIAGKIIGTIGLYDKKDAEGVPIPFDSEDLETVEGFASISAIAIDKQKAIEADLMRQQKDIEEKKRLSILFDSVQGGIITLRPDFSITSVNRYIEDWTGIAAADLIDKNALDVFHEKIGICPHCAAKPTFETGEVNSIMQSRGVNYADLTAYPIRNERGDVIEVVVFIMDITERILYQEETLSLYKEVIQTKDYLEGIINSSADAIVTCDLNGMVTSWNQSAERIFGFTEAEAAGRFLPFVPGDAMNAELQNIDLVRKGEMVRYLETIRMRKGGALFEASISLSPIKDASGSVVGICSITRDISEKKRVEHELIRKTQEMSRLFFISSAMRGTLELDRLLRMILTAVTMSDGMGFNRAILFLVDEEAAVLRGVMGVGPGTAEEAWQIWDQMSQKAVTLDDVMSDLQMRPLVRDSFLERLTARIEIPLHDESVLTRAVRERKMYNVTDVKLEPLADTILVQQLGTQAYAVVPLVSRDKVIGLIWVDNNFNRKPIIDEDMHFLMSFSNHVAAAIENARLFEKVAMAEQQLENIFESISDMVYFVDSDYVMKNINKAVSVRLNLKPSEIIGKKCYEVIHGLHGPYEKCPHYKTMTTKTAYIEEMDDPHLGGTFLTSSSPIFDSGGAFIGTVHVVRDISELKVLREKLIMSEKMAALGEVAAKVAHEIRNPLVSIGGFAKRLEKKLEGNLKEYATILVREVTRLEGILREILGFVKESRLARELLTLNELVEDTVAVMQSEIEEKGVRLTVQYGPLSAIFVDRNRVKEAFLNILANALQSLVGAGEIRVRTYNVNGSACLEVEDTGAGIHESVLPNIFNPFFTTKATGTGLGLAITHKIIHEHGGNIEVNSTIDKGTIFRVYLPIKEGST